jgi:hypothetical protein
MTQAKNPSSVIELPLMNPEKAVASDAEWSSYTKVDLEQIVEVLRQAAPATMSPQQVGLKIGRHNMTVQHRLAVLVKQGRVEWVRYGQYRLAPPVQVSDPTRPAPTRSYYRLSILKVLADAPRPLLGQEIAKLVERPPSAVASLLARMCRDGLIERVRKNVYTSIPDHFVEPSEEKEPGLVDAGLAAFLECIDLQAAAVVREIGALRDSVRRFREQLGIEEQRHD